MSRTCLVLFALASLLLTASPARAGNSFGSPHGFACAELDAASEMDDPNTGLFVIAGTKQCLKLCKLGGSQCKGFVNDAYQCNLVRYKANYTFGKANCKAVAAPEELKDCYAIAKEASEIQAGDLRIFRDSELENCDEWAAVCAATCQLT